jgi:hypothetical protein
MPPDPFLPDDPRLRDHPLFKYINEGQSLTLALADHGSLSALVEVLHTIERRDLELVAMFLLASMTRESLDEHARQAGLSAQEAAQRYSRWILGPPDAGTLDDL